MKNDRHRKHNLYCISYSNIVWSVYVLAKYILLFIEIREIFIDVETTGLQPENGRRVIEIAGLEIVNDQITGNIYHQFVKPERDIDEAAI